MSLRWDQVDLKAGLLHVARLKNGIASTHPIRRPLRALHELRRAYPASPYVFVTELGGPMSPATFRKLFARAGERASEGAVPNSSAHVAPFDRIQAR